MADMWPNFQRVYSTLKNEILNDPPFQFTDDSRQWVERMIDYNLLGGPLSLSVIDSYKYLIKGRELTEEEIFLASVLGWCIEWLQAYFLVLDDDIVDNSHTRHGEPCWFRLPKVGMIAINDAVVLRSHVPQILRKHFQGKPYYVDLNLFNEVACAFLMSGENLEKQADVQNILIEMGTYYQVQDDYFDCFGDPENEGKILQIGTDIEEFKCSWLAAKALELCNTGQKKLLSENYGKREPTNIAKVKALYNELNLQGIFTEFESKTYEKLTTAIESHPDKSVQGVLKSILGKIYKRQK